MNKGFRCFQFVVSVEDGIILLKPLCGLILSEKNARIAIFSDRIRRITPCVRQFTGSFLVT